MATVNFILQQPYKRSDNIDTIKAKEENRKIKEEIKKRRHQNKPISSLLNPRETRIYLFLIIDRNNKIKVKTDDTILPKYWDFKKQNVKPTYTGSVEFNERLSDLKTSVLNAYRILLNDNTNIKFSEIAENIKAVVKEDTLPVMDKKDKTFFQVFEEFMTVKKELQHERTIKRYNTLFITLKEFEKKRNTKLDFETIDMKFYDTFKNYLLKKRNPKREGMQGLLNDTIAKYFSTLKYFMKWSFDRNYHNNLTFQHEDFKATRNAKNEIVTLTDKELTELYKFDLCNNTRLERVRDLFCFATYTGQRWIDVINFNKKDITGDTWVFESLKTKKMHKVPFTGFCEPAKDILLKYDYDLPKISPQKFNNYIKEVGNIVGIDDEVTIKRYSGKKLIEIKNPKYLFMSSHMARRTCVTILLEKHIPPTTVMKLTRHSDLKTIMKYENTSEEALIKELDRVGDINKPMLKAV